MMHFPPCGYFQKSSPVARSNELDGSLHRSVVNDLDYDYMHLQNQQPQREPTSKPYEFMQRKKDKRLKNSKKERKVTKKAEKYHV